MPGAAQRASPGAATGSGGSSQNALAALEQQGTSRVMPRGAFLFHAGDGATHVYLIGTGTVKLGRVGRDGRETLLSILGPGDCAGELSGERHICDARTAEPSQVTAIPVDSIRDRGDPRASEALTALLLAQLRVTTTSLHGALQGDTRSRVAMTLFGLAERHGVRESAGVRLGIHLTQEDLARMTGSSRETVNRVLSTLARRGWVQGSHGRYVIDIDALREMEGV